MTCRFWRIWRELTLLAPLLAQKGSPKSYTADALSGHNFALSGVDDDQPASFDPPNCFP